MRLMRALSISPILYIYTESTTDRTMPNNNVDQKGKRNVFQTKFFGTQEIFFISEKAAGQPDFLRIGKATSQNDGVVLEKSRHHCWDIRLLC